MGDAPPPVRPRTLADAYEQARLVRTAPELVTTALPDVIDLRDPAPDATDADPDPTASLPFAEDDEDDAAGRWRARVGSAAVVVGVLMMGVATWGLTREAPLPAAGSSVSTETTVGTSTTSAPRSTTTATTVGATSTTAPPAAIEVPSTTRPSTPTTRRTTPTTRRPATTVPPSTAPPTTEPPTTAPPTTEPPTTAPPTTDPPTTTTEPEAPPEP